jgi:lysozyme
MTITSGSDLTKINEGLRLQAYDDRTGKPVPVGGVTLGTITIGYGHTGPDVVPGLVWTTGKCDAQFAVDYAIAQRRAARDVGLDPWSQIDAYRQAVLTDMAFELGERGLATFTDFLAAVRAHDWAAAAAHLQASKLFREVATRERRNVDVLLNGAWPDATPVLSQVPAQVARAAPPTQPPATRPWWSFWRT